MISDIKYAIHDIVPPAPKTNRGSSSSIDIAKDYLLYFNGVTAILQSLVYDTILYVNHSSNVVAAKFSTDGKYVATI